ncbi:MAG: hypothetical protein HUK03_06525 [Bacteroidaceae bacterium]|nr:hypothetical protein [Bacteroidaceae bacterium]
MIKKYIKPEVWIVEVKEMSIIAASIPVRDDDVEGDDTDFVMGIKGYRGLLDCDKKPAKRD